MLFLKNILLFAMFSATTQPEKKEKSSQKPTETPTTEKKEKGWFEGLKS